MEDDSRFNKEVKEMKTAIVTFDNGDSITTGINGTDGEIRAYYSINRVFNLGCNGDDFMARVVNVKIIQEERLNEK